MMESELFTLCSVTPAEVCQWQKLPDSAVLSDYLNKLVCPKLFYWGTLSLLQMTSVVTDMLTHLSFCPEGQVLDKNTSSCQ